MPDENTTRHGTCAICHCSIVKQGSRGHWYHGPERSATSVPGHYAEPVSS